MMTFGAINCVNPLTVGIKQYYPLKWLVFIECSTQPYIIDRVFRVGTHRGNRGENTLVPVINGHKVSI